MHSACMATKTVSLDIKAYERLREAREFEKESFSQVIHRAVWLGPKKKCGDLLDHLRRNPHYLAPKRIQILEKAQASDEPPGSKWS